MSQISELANLLSKLNGVVVEANPFLTAFQPKALFRNGDGNLILSNTSRNDKPCSHCKRLAMTVNCGLLGKYDGLLRQARLCVTCIDTFRKYYPRRYKMMQNAWPCGHCSESIHGSVNCSRRITNFKKTGTKLCSRCFLRLHAKCKHCKKVTGVEEFHSYNWEEPHNPTSLPEMECNGCLIKRGAVPCMSYLSLECAKFCNALTDKESVTCVDGVNFCPKCAATYLRGCKICSKRSVKARDGIYERFVHILAKLPPQADKRTRILLSCLDCYNEIVEGVGVHGYTFKPKPRFLGTGKEYLGVELEVCRDLRDGIPAESLETVATNIMGEVNRDNKRIYCKSDSSIARCSLITVDGFEIVTHPQTLEEQAKTWKLFSLARPKGLCSFFSGSCGMHVHISKRSFTSLSLKKFCYFINSEGNKAYIHDIAQRKSNDYTKLQHKALNKAADMNRERYSAVNLLNPETVEVRIFRGNVRYDRIMKGLEFCVALKEYCTLSSFSGLNHDDFVKWVAERSKTYTFLHNYHCEVKYFDQVPTVVSSQSPKYFSLEACFDKSEIGLEK